MRFEIFDKYGDLPDLVYGEEGRELSCFIPDNIDWRQVNYGQGEGQVLIDGAEWGFYYGDQNTISIMLHKGEVEVQSAFHFVLKTSKKVFGENANIKITLVGEDE